MAEDQSRFLLGVVGIIRDDAGRVLLLHRTDFELWNLPGGGVEEGESPWEAVVREIREETRLESEVDRLVGLYFKPDRDELVCAFECRVVGGEAGPTDEARDLRFFDPDELPENLSPRQVERIHDAVAGHPAPVMKVQSGPGARALIDEGVVRRVSDPGAGETP